MSKEKIFDWKTTGLSDYGLLDNNYFMVYGTKETAVQYINIHTYLSTQYIHMFSNHGSACKHA